MENETFLKATTTLELALGKARDATDTADPASVAALAEFIGVMGRDDFLALLGVWKQRYGELSARSRTVKPQRKGGNTTASDEVLTLRRKARKHLAVRAALKQMARAHAAATRAKAA
jgi:hypothetical protein